MSTTLPTVLLVDDRPNMLELLSKVLRHDARVLRARGALEARDVLEREAVSVVVSDLKMPDGDGLMVLDATRELRPYAAFILITGHATVENAVEAMRRGAYDYLTKPFEPEHVRALVLRALGGQAVEQPPDTPVVAPLDGVVGASRAMRALAYLAREAGAGDEALMISGERETGRRTMARAIHANAGHRGDSLIEWDASGATLAEVKATLESTSAPDWSGAQGGTLIVLGLEVAAAAGAELIAQRLRREGVAARLIVIINALDGVAPSAWPGFRGLFVPALRERTGDVSRLANHFLGATLDADGAIGFTPTAIEMLERYTWPGNVSELATAIGDASLLAAGRRIDVADLPQAIRDADDDEAALALLSYQQAVDFARADATKRYLEAVLRRTSGVVTAAAEVAGIERESFYRLLRKHGVNADDFRKSQE